MEFEDFGRVKNTVYDTRLELRNAVLLALMTILKAARDDYVTLEIRFYLNKNV